MLLSADNWKGGGGGGLKIIEILKEMVSNKITSNIQLQFYICIHFNPDTSFNNYPLEDQIRIMLAHYKWLELELTRILKTV